MPHDRNIPDENFLIHTSVEQKEMPNDTLNSPWTEDAFGDRQEIGETLTDLVASVEDSFVLSLDGEYGAGKSWFLQRWQQHLTNEKYICAYFNAWENDYNDDPFFPFLATILEALKIHLPEEEQQKKDIQTKHQKLLENAVPIGKELGKIALKGGLSKLIGSEAVQDAQDLFFGKESDFISDDTEKALINLATDEITSHIHYKTATQSFKSQLTGLIETLTKDKESEQQKIILIIDELDRCKPTYAVKLLERIKHIFETKGLVFVLGMKKQQVAEAMRVVYGQRLNAESYLDRFIHWQFKLPAPDITTYPKVLVKKFGLNSLTDTNNFQDPIKKFQDYFAAACAILGLSLRDQERLMTEANLYMRTVGKSEPEYYQYLGLFLPYWRHTDAFQNILESGFSQETIAKFKQDINEEQLVKHIEKIKHSSRNLNYFLFYLFGTELNSRTLAPLLSVSPSLRDSSQSLVEEFAQALDYPVLKIENI